MPRGAWVQTGQVSPGKVRTVDEITTELYAVPLDQFTPTRNAAARELKAAGDANGAREVQALKKPTLAAWFVNQLVRNEPERIKFLARYDETLHTFCNGICHLSDEHMQSDRSKDELGYDLATHSKMMVELLGGYLDRHREQSKGRG